MAEGTSVSEDNVACRFFLAGLCKDGPNCLFSHDELRQIPDSVCRYYLLGKCIFGLNCRYDHIPVNEVNASTTNSINDSSKYSFPSSSSAGANSWINAPIFIPHRSYADAVRGDNSKNNESERSSEKICPYFAAGYCPILYCRLIHGNKCELCHKAYLHPFNDEARKSHIEKCEKEIEQNMEFSFAIQRSLKQCCGICMDVVLEKEPISERRFGLLENCCHVYCLSCIRKWRRSRRYESNQLIDNILDPRNIKACPECRIASDFIIPSNYFIDTREEKDNLIREYKTALSKKHCKYFKQGEGVCPFGGSCFYLHDKPVDFPVHTRRYRQDETGEFDYMGMIRLWDYLEFREGNAVPSITDNESSDTSN